MRKILTSLMVIGLIAVMTGGSIFAYFWDVETSTGNTFAAGTLDIKIRGFTGTEERRGYCNLDDVRHEPRDIFVFGMVELRNVGSLAADHLEIRRQ